MSIPVLLIIILPLTIIALTLCTLKLAVAKSKREKKIILRLSMTITLVALGVMAYFFCTSDIDRSAKLIMLFVLSVSTVVVIYRYFIKNDILK